VPGRRSGSISGVSSTDPVPGPDEAGGEADPAASGSRARVAGLGWLPWAAGVALAAAQLLVLVIAPGDWRAAGAVVLVVVTLAAVGYAVFGGDRSPDQRRFPKG
jgi:hypothetical protein